MADKKDKRGGARKGSGWKKGDKRNRGRHPPTPEQFMNSLVPAGPRIDHDKSEHVKAERVEPGQGFGEIPPKIDPVEFCLAVINNDRRVLGQLGLIEIPSMDQRLFAARVAIPFTNKRKPVEVVSKHQFSWVDEISAAEQRARQLRKDPNDDPTRTVN